MSNFSLNKMDYAPFVNNLGPPLKTGSQLTIIMAREKCGVSYVSDVINSKSEDEREKMLKRLSESLNISIENIQAGLSLPK